MNRRRLGVALDLLLREQGRSRFALVLLLVVPATFYAVARLTGSPQPVAFELGSLGPDVLIRVPQVQEIAVFIGLAATGLLTSFVGLRLSQRDVEPSRRLVACGYRASELLAARLGVLLLLTAGVSLVVSAGLPVLFFRPSRGWPLLGAFALCGLVYGAYGLLVGALVRRELEGILLIALLANLDVGWLQNPVWYAEAQRQWVIRALPAYFPSQAAMASAFTDRSPAGPFLGGAAYALGLLSLAALAWSLRMRRR